MRNLLVLPFLVILTAACTLVPTPQPLATNTALPVPTSTLAPNKTATPTVAPADTRAPASTQNTMPIFDTHVHYSRNSWNEYAPQEILDKLIGANVARALVSSSPDEGTRRLYELDPVRIVPGLRPYHDDVTSSNWETNDKTLPYIQARINSPVYAAFGEIHVHLDNIESPIFQDAVERALARDLILHIHSDAATVRAVMAKYPNAKILWAHAGLIETPQTVSQVLDEFPNVWTDISLREYSIAPNGKLSDEWRALCLKHPTRITIGSDTWIPERWTGYEKIMEHDRAWLNQLPRDVVENIAYRNAFALFGISGAEELEK